MPSIPTVLGLLVGCAALVITFVTDAPVTGVVLAVAVLGWATFALRDLIRAVRNRPTA